MMMMMMMIMMMMMMMMIMIMIMTMMMTVTLTSPDGGVCSQQQFHIPILRREPGKCMRLVSRGQEFTTDKWYLSTYPLRIGCECQLRKNSQFVKFARLP